MRDSRHELFRSGRSARKTHEGTVLLLSGWLGEETMRDSVIPPLTAKGFNVVMVDHSRNTGVQNCNLARSKDVHNAARMAVSSTQDPIIHIIAHSKGGQDAVNFMEYYQQRRYEVPYTIHGYGAIATVGRNGKHPGVRSVIKEFAQHGGEVWHNAHGERSVLGTSIRNLGKSPLLAYAEGVTAARADTSKAIEALRAVGAFQHEVEIYGSHDYLVPAPTDRVVEKYDGHHMTPVYMHEVIVDVAHRLAA